MLTLHRRLRPVGALCLSALLVAGCAKATVTPTQRPTGALPRPDRVLVYDFAVTPEDVALDRGVGPKVTRGTGSAAQTNEEIQVGRAVARALSDHLVQELRSRGINAYHVSRAAPHTDTTASITGQFLNIDQGNRTLRTLVGFGLGGSEVRTHIQMYQGVPPHARLVAQGETATQSSLKPGMGAMLGVGAAAGTLGTSAAVAGGSTVASETFLATVAADAKRTAKEVAKRVASYYKQQGWINP